MAVARQDRPSLHMAQSVTAVRASKQALLAMSLSKTVPTHRERHGVRHFGLGGAEVHWLAVRQLRNWHMCAERGRG